MVHPCDSCSNQARVYLVAGARHIGRHCAACAVAAARSFANQGIRARVDAMIPAQLNPWTTSDGRFFDRDADAREHQRMLDQRAVDFARRVGRLVAQLEIRQAAA